MKKTELTRREFLGVLAIGAGGVAFEQVLFPTRIAQAAIDSGLNTKGNTTFTAETGDGIVNILKYSPPLSLAISRQPGHDGRKFDGEYLIGYIPDVGGPGLNNDFFHGTIIYLVKETKTNAPGWSEQEAVRTAKALATAVLANARAYNFDPRYPGVGNPVRRNPIYILNQDSPRRPEIDAANGIQPLLDGDIVWARANGLINEPSDGLINGLASELAKSLNFLADFWITGSKSLQEYAEPNNGVATPMTTALIEGMGAYVGKLATGKWMLTQRPKEELERDLKIIDPEKNGFPFYSHKGADFITLAGMAIEQIEGQLPGVMGYALSQLALQTAIRVGAGDVRVGREKIYDLRYQGLRPLIDAGTFGSYGDAYAANTKGNNNKPFSRWLEENRIFHFSKVTV